MQTFLFFKRRMILPSSANWTAPVPLAAEYNSWSFSIIHSVSWKNIRQTQEILGIYSKYEKEWGPSISNGTIMVMERFYETPLDKIPASHDPVSARMYQLLHAPDYSLTRYSIGHFADFIRGILSIMAIGKKIACPSMLNLLLERAGKLLSSGYHSCTGKKKSGDKLQPQKSLNMEIISGIILNRQPLTLIEIYGKLDAWYSMAMAGKEFNLVMPEILDSEFPFIEVKSLHHLLLPEAVSYDVHMDPKSNFFFLTGANMAGKSTFIKSVGAALFLAHLGMGVPADTDEDQPVRRYTQQYKRS